MGCPDLTIVSYFFYVRYTFEMNISSTEWINLQENDTFMIGNLLKN